MVLHVADDSIEKYYHSIYKKYKKYDDAVVKTISHLLRNMTTKKDNAYHIDPTMKEFCVALESQKVSYKEENGTASAVPLF